MGTSDPTAFLAELEHRVLGHPVLAHHLWADLERGRCGRESLCTFTVHYYHHVLRTRLYDAAALACCPDEGIQRALVSILWDEYGRGDPACTHPAQFRKVLRALGIDVEVAEQTPRLHELEVYSRVHFDLCRPSSFWEALGAVGFAMEWAIPPLYERLLRAYRRIAGLTNGDLEFFLEHVPTDQYHASLIISSLGPHLGSLEVQASLVKGALSSLDARELLIDAIARKMGEAVSCTSPQ
jgi:pyrroloquinoline-quinone synthase